VLILHELCKYCASGVRLIYYFSSYYLIAVYEE
jgi:hypothetical protein